jgi:hypothetical protein
MGLLGRTMEISMSPSMSPSGSHAHRVRRWIIPLAGGTLAAVLIVIGTPHVAWYMRLVLAAVAFLYISGQSAAYLWSSHTDQG